MIKTTPFEMVFIIREIIMKKQISFILAVVLILGMIPPVYAAQLPFTDVKQGSWYADAVEYVYSNGLMNGTGETTFSPGTNMSRAMIVTVLHRLEGSPASSVQLPFDDVPGKKYYSEAVRWSYENGIVNGVSATKFAPDANVTREQLVTIFYRYANAKGYSTTGMDDLSNRKLGYFTDADKLHNYARNAMVWAEVNGIINGVTETTLVPDGNATRAQFATIMKRFADWQEKRHSPAEVLTEQKDALLHADLQARIDEILNTETEIVHSDTFIPGKTYTGTAYYFSNDGDDYNNDGLSPESPWQSVVKMVEILDSKNGQVLKSGDAVFLRRGDTFRLPNDLLEVSVDGVTISAYGEGEKPIITASSENGSGADKWKLVYEDNSGKKIWQFYKDIRDTSMVIFNDGEAFAERVYEYYDGANYISCKDTWWWMHDGKGVSLLDGLLPLEESLTEDMTFIFHDMASTTTTYEWYPDDTRISGGYYHVLDNVVFNTAGIRLDPSYALKYLDSVIIRGNQIWDTGAMDKGKIYYSEGSLDFIDGFYGEVIVEDNVFYGTKNGHPKNGLLNINLYSPREDMRLPGGIIPVIRDNTYVQYSGRKFGHFAMWWTDPDNQPNMDVFIDDPDLKTKVAEITGDTTSQFYVVEKP